MSSIASPEVPYRWQELGDYLSSQQSQLLDNEIRLALHSEWKEISHLEENLDDAILVALVGGTGVGKSTLINALAGHTISRSGDRRPTTSRVVLYIHRETDLPLEVPQEDFAQPFVLHANPRISKVVILDFPDFDSAESTHAAVLSRYLPYLDVLLVVVDDVKYADQRLYDLLMALQQDPANIFVVLNKIDRLKDRYKENTPKVIDEILVDLQKKLRTFASIHLERDHLFAIAAKPVHLAREASPKTPPPVDPRFEALESRIEHFQEAKHRRLAKEMNILARKQALAEQIANRVLSPINQETLRRLNSLVTSASVELDQSLSVTSPTIYSDVERRAARTAWMREAGHRWGLPVSLFFTLLGELPWNRSRESSDPTDVAARVERHYAGYLEAAKNLSRRFDAELAGIPWADSTQSTAPKNNAMQTWVHTATLALQQAAIPNRSGLHFFRKLSAHFLPVLVLLVAVLTRSESVLGLERSIWERMTSLLGLMNPLWILNTFLAIVIAYFVTALVIWLREIQRLEKALSLGESKVRDEVTQVGSEQSRLVVQRLEELQREISWVERIVSAESAETK